MDYTDNRTPEQFRLDTIEASRRHPGLPIAYQDGWFYTDSFFDLYSIKKTGIQGKPLEIILLQKRT